jgi:hypothetical protein
MEQNRQFRVVTSDEMEKQMQVSSIVAAMMAAVPALALAEETIQVRATAAPPIVSPGQATEITVLAFSADRGPLRDAQVSIWAGDGVFSNGTSAIFGETDADGLFKTNWTCYRGQCGPGGGFGILIEVKKRGFKDNTEDVHIKIE